MQLTAFCVHALVDDATLEDVVDSHGSHVGVICSACAGVGGVLLPAGNYVQRRLPGLERRACSGPLPGRDVTIVQEPGKTKVVTGIPSVDPRAAADPKKVIEYVVGFLFNRPYSRVVLIEKTKPSWQAGRLNGPGGKIEDGETPHEAMIREFHEETGVIVPEWRGFAIGTLYNGPGLTCKVHFFTAVVPDWNLDEAGTKTMELVRVYDVLEVQAYARSCPRRLMSNLHWLIPMAMTMSVNTAGRFSFVEEN
jgi:8-oxo-dGTP diphosphatase